MQQLELIQPDDWHCHLRDGAFLSSTVPMAAKQFKRVIVMPNLNPPVTTVSAAQDYYQRIQRLVPKFHEFEPLMTLYLTDNTKPSDIIEAKQSQIVVACKLYPAHVTTHSQHGVTELKNLYPVFEAMAKQQMPLLIHGEVNSPDIDIFDREAVFIERHLSKLIKDFPELKIVFEHITTEQAVDFVKQGPKNLAATITPHHLMLNRNAIFVGGIRPHLYCLPVLKRQTHQEALIKAATSGNPKFFLGTDSAPHAKSKKEAPCGCAGIFNHHAAIEMYAHVFEQANALDKLEGFASKHGPDFYNLPYNTQKIRLVKTEQRIEKSLPFADEELIPFMADETLTWQKVT
jgi:dihydroorotase